MSKRSQRDQRIERALEAIEQRLYEAHNEASSQLYLHQDAMREPSDRRFERIVAGLPVTPAAEGHEMIRAECLRIERQWAANRAALPYQGPRNNLSLAFYGDAPDPGTIANRHAAIDRMNRSDRTLMDEYTDRNVSPFGLTD